MVKRIIAVLIIIILIGIIVYLFMTLDRKDKVQVSNEDEKKISRENMEVLITVGDKNFIATLEDNETSQAFMELLPMTIKMKELHANEKYYDLDTNLPFSKEHYPKIETGDLMLYGDKTIVLFYESFTTTYSYTRIGKVQDINGLKEALGTSEVEVTFNYTN